jgi:hypothetical protein
MRDMRVQRHRQQGRGQALEDIQERLTESQYMIFSQIEQTLGTSLEFFGSITRYDYFPGKSDVDARMFTENPATTLFQLKSLFSHISVKKMYLLYQGKMFHATKVSLLQDDDDDDGEHIDIVIYRKRDRRALQPYFRKDENISILHITLLYLLKLFYYYGGLPEMIYYSCKQFIYNNYKHNKFVLLKPHIRGVEGKS